MVVIKRKTKIVPNFTTIGIGSIVLTEKIRSTKFHRNSIQKNTTIPENNFVSFKLFICKPHRPTNKSIEKSIIITCKNIEHLVYIFMEKTPQFRNELGHSCKISRIRIL